VFSVDEIFIMHCVICRLILFGCTRIMKVDLSFPSTPCVSAEAKDLILRVSLLMIVLC
jgi:hypothetical protein